MQSLERTLVYTLGKRLQCIGHQDHTDQEDNMKIMVLIFFLLIALAGCQSINFTATKRISDNEVVTISGKVKGDMSNERFLMLLSGIYNLDTWDSYISKLMRKSLNK